MSGVGGCFGTGGAGGRVGTGGAGGRTGTGGAGGRAGTGGACGFGFGDVVILELLANHGLIPDISPSTQDVVFCLNSELRSAAMQVATKLRAQGRSVDLVLEVRKMKWVLRHADRCGAERLFLLAPQEWESGNVRIKNMETGDESDLSFAEL